MIAPGVKKASKLHFCFDRLFEMIIEGLRMKVWDRLTVSDARKGLALSGGYGVSEKAPYSRRTCP
jgi:hypothetical protein